MAVPILRSARWRGLLSTCLAFAIAIGPSLNVFAQTNAAQQAVRQRVSGLDGGGPPGPPPESAAPPTAPPTSPEGTTSTASTPDTRYISPTAAAVVILRPAQLLTAPIAELFPTEVASAAGLQYLGINPADIDEVTVFAEPYVLGSPPAFGATIKFNKPFRASSLPQTVRPFAKIGDLNGKKYLQSSHPMFPSFYGVNSQTMLVAPDAELRKMIESQKANQAGPLSELVRKNTGGNDLYLAVDAKSVMPLLMLGAMQSGAQAQMQQATQVLQQLSGAELTVNIAGPGPISLVVHGKDEAAAQQIEAMIQAGVAAMTAPSASEQLSGSDQVQQAMTAYKQRMSQFVQPRRDGAAVTCFYIDGSNQVQKQVVGMMLIGTIASGIGQAMKGMPMGRGPRGDVATNNMKQIMLACMNLESAMKMYPPHAHYSADDKPLLSWRVQILPFLEQQALYDKFKKDEPWDSEHNKALLLEMPDVFKNPSKPAEPGKTTFLGVVGEPCIFTGTKDGVRIKQVTDGTSKTIAVVEVGPELAVEWAKPDDWQFDANDPLKGLADQPGGWLAGFADGSVRRMPLISPEMAKAFFTRNGDEAIDENAATPPPGAGAVPVPPTGP